MRWFKHFSDSLDDPFIQSLIDEFGATGYLVYFGIIEIICKENGTKLDGKLEISPTYLRRKLRTSQGKVRQVLDFCQGFGKLSVNFSEKLWSFNFPKITEIKDNYTKDLQASSKKPSNHKEVEEEKEVEVEVEKEKDILSGLVIDYLNLILNSKYRKTGQKIKTLIKARQDEGHTLDDFKKVIDIKYAEWKDTDMSKFLRPETLFGTKFESYLNQKPPERQIFSDKTKGNFELIKRRAKEREDKEADNGKILHD